MATTVILQLTDSMPAPGGAPEPTPRGIPLEEKVRDMIDCVESGEDSTTEWLTLNKLHGMLSERSDKRSKALLKVIEPVMAKYGQYGVPVRSK